MKPTPALPDASKARKTYATRENAVKALEKLVEPYDQNANPAMRYVIAVDTDGRFYPVVIGMDWLTLVHSGIAVVA